MRILLSNLEHFRYFIIIDYKWHGYIADRNTSMSPASFCAQSWQLLKSEIDVRISQEWWSKLTAFMSRYFEYLLYRSLYLSAASVHCISQSSNHNLSALLTTQTRQKSKTRWMSPMLQCQNDCDNHASNSLPFNYFSEITTARIRNGFNGVSVSVWNKTHLNCKSLSYQIIGQALFTFTEWSKWLNAMEQEHSGKLMPYRLRLIQSSSSSLSLLLLRRTLGCLKRIRAKCRRFPCFLR